MTDTQSTFANKLPVWRVNTEDVDSDICYVRAESEEEAKSKALDDEPSDWFAVIVEEAGMEALYVNRIPELDSELSMNMLVGMNLAWAECSGCGAHLYGGKWTKYADDFEDIEDDPEEGVIWPGPNGEPYCSEKCWVKDGSRSGGVNQVSICLDGDY